MVGSYIEGGIKCGRKDLDITDLGEVLSVCEQYRPKAIIHLAALTDLAACEKNPAEAYKVNAVGAYHMALAARSVGAKLIYVSTSGVFDGKKKEPYIETDTPNPINVYGHSKYLGELAVKGVLDDALIVRTSWIFGGGKSKDKKFVGKMLAKKENAEVSVVTDKSGSPTYAKDLAQVLQAFALDTTRGVVHVGGGIATRYVVAKEIFALAGSGTVVLPSISSDVGGEYASGENESMPRFPRMRPWQDALREYIVVEWGTR